MWADDGHKITGAKKTDSKKLDEVLKGVLNEIYDRVK